MQKLIFNAKLQKETLHELVLNDNDEVVATCTETGSMLKFPNVAGDELDVLIAKHAEANLGQRVRKPFLAETEEVK